MAEYTLQNVREWTDKRIPPLWIGKAIAAAIAEREELRAENERLSVDLRDYRRCDCCHEPTGKVAWCTTCAHDDNVVLDTYRERAERAEQRGGELELVVQLKDEEIVDRGNRIRELESAGAPGVPAMLAKLASDAAPTPYEYDAEHCVIVGNGHSPSCSDDCQHVHIELEREDLDYLIAAANFVGRLLASAPPAPAADTTKHPDDVAVDLFAAAMKAKLEYSRNKHGRGGWNDKTDCSAERLSDLLRGHVAKGDPVDVANFACFLWNRQEAISSAAVVFDLIAHLRRQREFSERTFGPGARTNGVVDHIRKELVEIEAEPHDISELVDVILLALDGAWRSGADPDEIAFAIAAKQLKNEKRDWPDWRTADPNKAIEHVRTSSHSASTEGTK